MINLLDKFLNRPDESVMQPQIEEAPLVLQQTLDRVYDVTEELAGPVEDWFLFHADAE